MSNDCQNKPKLNQSDLEKLDFSGVEEMEKKNFEFLQKLGNPIKDKSDPIEEVKKEWEDDRFKFNYHPNDYNIIHIYNDYGDVIYIWEDKEYGFEGFGGALPIKLHIRLTKTFRALGWEVLEDE